VILKGKLQAFLRMGKLTPGANYIYESPDGGETIYAREVGTSKRTLVGYQYDMFTKIDWYDMVLKARTNPTLQKTLNRAILIYETIKNE
jgi:hypothetical protein